MGRRGVQDGGYAWVGYLVVGALLVVVIGAGYLLRDNLAGSPGELRVGDCFNEPGSDTTGSVMHVPCGEPHQAEVFLVGTLESQSVYPGDATFVRWMEQHCSTAALATYTGTAAAERASIRISLFYPTREAWSFGGRSLSCYLHAVDGVPTVGSLRASPAPSN
jgi:hypothetical protein